MGVIFYSLITLKMPFKSKEKLIKGEYKDKIILDENLKYLIK